MKEASLTPRPERSVVKCNEEPLPQLLQWIFRALPAFYSLKSLGNWTLKIFDDRIVLKKMVDLYVLPHLGIITDDNLGFTVKVFWFLFP